MAVYYCFPNRDLSLCTYGFFPYFFSVLKWGFFFEFSRIDASTLCECVLESWKVHQREGPSETEKINDRRERLGEKELADCLDAKEREYNVGSLPAGNARRAGKKQIWVESAAADGFSDNFRNWWPRIFSLLSAASDYFL
jgi:hypothetical protein